MQIVHRRRSSSASFSRLTWTSAPAVASVAALSALRPPPPGASVERFGRGMRVSVPASTSMARTLVRRTSSLPRHPANTFVLLWELHLQGETPARSWLFRDPVLRRIEEATRSRTRAQRAAKLREIEEEERRALAPPPREPGSDEEDDEEDESD